MFTLDSNKNTVIISSTSNEITITHTIPHGNDGNVALRCGIYLLKTTHHFAPSYSHKPVLAS